MANWSLPRVFNTLVAGNQPASYFDDDFVFLRDGKVEIVDTITTLKTVAVPASMVAALVVGVSSTAGNNGGLYWWNSVDTRADNAITIIQPNAGGNGRWNLITNLNTSGTGANNTILGVGALAAATTASDNTVVGKSAGSLMTTGTSNVAVGENALRDLLTGGSNTAVGTSAGLVCTGSNNTFIGIGAGSTATTGSNNTLIGHTAQPSAVNVSNEVTIGDASVATARIQVAWTVLSDGRDKEILGDLSDVDCLGLIERVPVHYGNLAPRDADWKKPMPFVVAQEILEVTKALGLHDKLQLIKEDNPDRLEMNTGNWLPVMLQAIKQLAEKVKT